MLSYEKVDLKNYFKVFHEKLINYDIKEINNSEDILMIIQYLKDPKSLFDHKNKPKDLTTEEERSKVNKSILAIRFRQYI